MSSLPQLTEFPQNNLLLNQNAICQLRVLLDHSIHQSDSGLCAILEETGSVIAQADRWKGPDLTETGILAAASYGASLELSKRLDNPGPPQLLLENERFNVLVTPLVDNFLMLNIFGCETNAGIIKHVAKSTAEKIAEVVGSLRNSDTVPSANSS